VAENYSTNSVQKVWAAKFAARHPNVVVLDLSSFKCGHDAPWPDRLDHLDVGDAYSALHDIDANKPGGRSRSVRPTPTRSLHEAPETPGTARRGSSSGWKKAPAAAGAEAPAAGSAQQDPALEAMINETKVKVSEYSAESEPTAEANPRQLAKDAGLVRLGIMKRVDKRSRGALRPDQPRNQWKLSTASRPVRAASRA
jgi:hypothetical protein